ncbi:MAG: TIGR03067 domain-containing protein [Fimbriiglobus sp.]
MKILNITLASVGLLLLNGCGSESTPPTTPKAAVVAPTFPEELKGTWHVTSIEAAGTMVPTDRVQKMGLVYIFEEGKVTIQRPDRPASVSTIVVDITSTPYRITINQTPQVRALFAVKEKKLELCIMVDDNPNSGFPRDMISTFMPKSDLLKLEQR